jgi:hypothetical protein
MKPRYATRYRYDTDMPIRKNFKKSISDTVAIYYINAQYINMAKINNINNENFFERQNFIIIINVNSSLYKDYKQANKLPQDQNSLRLNIQGLICPKTHNSSKNI